MLCCSSSGHQQTCQVLCSSWWRELHRRSTPAARLPPVSHVRTVHALRVHSGASLLRTSRRVPLQVLHGSIPRNVSDFPAKCKSVHRDSVIKRRLVFGKQTYMGYGGNRFQDLSFHYWSGLWWVHGQQRIRTALRFVHDEHWPARTSPTTI